MSGPQTLLASTFELIADGDLDGVARALSLEPELVNKPTFFGGGTLLHYAAAQGSVEMMALLIERGFDLNARGAHYGDTPLHTACCWGKASNARFLLGHGACLVAEHSYTDPLFGAVMSGSLEVVALLMAAGANARRRYTLESGQSVNAAEFARLKGQVEIAAVLERATGHTMAGA